MGVAHAYAPNSVLRERGVEGKNGGPHVWASSSVLGEGRDNGGATLDGSGDVGYYGSGKSRRLT